ncbi:MAG: signal peptidase I [Candidatus Eremiobacteraeota bacterium]|nr:signal peptidase I [Candidatus Eremiobacteraeota bacterium]
MTPTQLAILIGILLIVRVILHFSKKIKIEEKRRKVLYEYLDSIIIAGVTALVLIHFVVRTFYIPSTSMVPTLVKHDYIMVNEFIYRFKTPERREIVVFHPPESANAGGKDFIKRVIAVENDEIEVKEGKVFINNVVQDEPFINEAPEYLMEKRKVPEGSLFVMGDNRNNSDDSHRWGFLPRKNVVGKAFLIFWPPQRIRVLK